MQVDQQESWIRVSCASLCRIIVDNKYLLLLNANRRQKKIYELSPVGGAIVVDDWAALNQFDVQPENSDTRDLRLLIKASQVDAYREWFYARESRETSPFRELHEELVEETGILFSLKLQDVSFRYIHTVEDRKQTLRQGLTGQFTQYFFEIYDVHFRAPEILFRLKLAPPQAGAVLVSKEEAKAGDPQHMIFDGAQRLVALNTQYLFAEGRTGADAPFMVDDSSV